MKVNSLNLDESTIIESFLLGANPGYRKVEAWIDTVLQYHGWGFRLDPLDLKQTVMIAILENLRESKYRGHGLKGYVQSICKRICVDELRKSYREERMLNESESMSVLRFESGADENSAENLRYNLFLKIMAELGESCKELLYWKFQDRLSHKDIGLRLDMTEGASRVKVHRCLDETRKIRARIEND